MKRYIRATIRSIDDLEVDELELLCEDPNASKEDLLVVLHRMLETTLPPGMFEQLLIALICNPKITESDIPSELLSDIFIQRSILCNDNAPAWFLAMIYRENPRYLYDSMNMSNCSLYMLDLVRHPNLPEDIRKAIVDKFPDLADGQTVFEFTFTDIDFLSDPDMENIEEIIQGMVSKHPELTDPMNCEIYFLSEGKVEMNVPGILVKKRAQCLGEYIADALNSAGYNVSDDWEFDDV